MGAMRGRGQQQQILESWASAGQVGNFPQPAPRRPSSPAPVLALSRPVTAASVVRVLHILGQVTGWANPLREINHLGGDDISVSLMLADEQLDYQR